MGGIGGQHEVQAGRHRRRHRGPDRTGAGVGHHATRPDGLRQWPARGPRRLQRQSHRRAGGLPGHGRAGAGPISHRRRGLRGLPHRDGGDPFAGGRPFETDFGTIYSPNITPDAETGIGSWSDADFLRAVHEGIAKDGTHLYPAFPYASYTYLTDEDVLAIKAYLFSLPPVKNTAPENTLHWPYNQRGLMAIWSKLYNPDKRFEPVADQSRRVEPRRLSRRGARSLRRMPHAAQFPAGAQEQAQVRRRHGRRLARVQPDSDQESGIGAWSAVDLEQYLKTGHSADRGSAFGPMAQAVHLSFQKLTPIRCDRHRHVRAQRAAGLHAGPACTETRARAGRPFRP